MHSFKDQLDREWHVALDVAAVARVKSRLDVNLYKVLDDRCDLFQRLGADIELAVNLLYVLIADQAAAAGVGDEDFGRGLAGDAIDRAMEALVAETVAFFPHRTRTILGTVREKTIQATETTTRLAIAMMDAVTPEDMAMEARAAIARAIILEKIARDVELQRASEPSNSSGGPPASAASTPADSP
jgi:hypothetical protein